MEMFTVKMPEVFEALLGDARLLSTAARLADARHSAAAQPPVLSEVSRHFCAVLAAHLTDSRLNLLKVGCAYGLTSVTHSDLSIPAYSRHCPRCHFCAVLPAHLTDSGLDLLKVGCAFEFGHHEFSPKGPPLWR